VRGHPGEELERIDRVGARRRAIGSARLAYAQLGDWKSAMDWIVRERALRPRRFRLWVTNPDMVEVRRDPRFMALVKEDGLQPLLAAVSTR
jgi:hypothetical protein